MNLTQLYAQYLDADLWCARLPNDDARRQLRADLEQRIVATIRRTDAGGNVCEGTLYFQAHEVKIGREITFSYFRVSNIDPRPIDDGFTGYSFSKASSLAPTVKGEQRRSQARRA